MKSAPNCRRLFTQSLLWALALRAFLQFIAFLAIKFIPFKGSFPYWETVLADNGPAWLWFWGNFDGVHYLNIAQSSYAFGLTQAFFPLYPIAIRWFNLLIHNPLVSSLLISHLSLIGFLYFFIKLGLKDYSVKSLLWSLALILLFPTSFFFFGTYTESFFLLLSAAAFYFARQNKFTLAFALTGLATATRLVGVFLVPAILWEYLRLSRHKPKLYQIVSHTLLGLSGLLIYLAYLQSKFNDFLIFVRSQPDFGGGRQVDKLIMIYQVVFRYLKMIFTVSPQNEIYPVIIFEFILSITFFSLLIYLLIKKFRTSYLLFTLPAFLLPTLTGTFASMPRYLLTLFPLFYFLGDIKSPKAKIIIAIISLLLLIWAFIRFTRGYWIS